MANRELTTDVVLISGANKGLGFETARVLASRGATVLMGARDPERGEKAVAELASAADCREATVHNTLHTLRHKEIIVTAYRRQFVIDMAGLRRFARMP